MHGLGNDFIVLNDWNQQIKDYVGLSKNLCRRGFSVGADGVIILCKPSNLKADFSMRIFNTDGSEAEMCGNGIRCLARYVYENSLIQKLLMKVETLAGLKTVKLELNNGIIKTVSVDMGCPVYDHESKCFSINGEKTGAYCLSIGNPHCVIFVNDVNDTNVEKFGPMVETHSCFPNRVNVEFVEIVDRQNLKIRVWERGCGETLACGTGACASAAIAHKIKKVDNEVVVHLRGGDLVINLNDRIHMKGPAVKVYEGFI
jgi:diaminopimelate epimerase